jgi:hypothetical protein
VTQWTLLEDVADVLRYCDEYRDESVVLGGDPVPCVDSNELAQHLAERMTPHKPWTEREWWWQDVPGAQGGWLPAEVRGFGGLPGGYEPGPRGGSSPRDRSGPGGPLTALCALSWTSAQWAAFMTRYCEKRHGGVGGAGAATPEEAAERVRTCDGWTRYGFGVVVVLCGAF